MTAIRSETPSATFSRTLLNVGWRYLLRHPWQTILMILGVTLGVAVVVAIDLANASAGRAFDLSTEAVAGRATHQIVGGPVGLDEEIYVGLRRQGVLGPARAAAPIVTAYTSSPQLGDRPLQLLGVDPFAEAPFRDYLTQAEVTPAEGLTPFLTQPGAVLISTDVASRYELTAGTSISLEVGGQMRSAFVAGLLQPDLGSRVSRRALEGLILTDVATAQELTGRLGKLDRVDLILPRDEGGAAGPVAQRINALLPQGVRITPVQARSGTIEQMTAAFRTNLTALSLLALVVGLFLIYNTMTFSVVQRRPLFGTLRCLGVTRREIFILVLSEALAVGVISAGLGLLLGVVMGQGAVGMVTQTINDLYFVVTVRGVQIPASSLVKGALLGVLATALTAVPPAWEAASVPPRAALSRSALESKAQRAVALAAAGGLAMLLVGVGLLAVPTRDLTVSFAGTFAVTVGFAMLTPLITGLLMRALTRPTGLLWGALGRMAPRDVVKALSRTSIAVAALMVAVSVTIGVNIMINSFRHTVVIWLEQTLQGDIYVSAPSLTASQSPSTPIDPAVIQALQARPEIARVDTLRAVSSDSPYGLIQLAATQNPQYGEERLYLATDRPPPEIWGAMQSGAVLVSEPFMRRADLPRSGGQVTLDTDQGPHTFPVVGIFYDYASSQGTVVMSLDTYRRWWQDDALTALALRLRPDSDADALARTLQGELAPIQRLLVRPNQALRRDVLLIFDRTFAITSALQLLATVVAFIGVLSALLSLLLEKQRELGILRAVGLTVRQLWGLVMLETGLMGAVAGLLAMPTGFVLALILVYIINQRAFGWTLQMQVGPAPFIQALIVAVVAALLAGLYPARRMSQTVTADAMRFE
jgi:putative ABC transport system permease protein